jgi:PAS domain S-box-containing protein
MEMSLEEYRAAFDHGVDAVIIGTPDGRILAANPAACAMFGMSEAELRMAGRSAILDESDPRWIVARDVRSAQVEQEGIGRVQAEMTLRRADGSTFEADTRSTEYVLSGGRRRICVTLHDVSASADLILRQNELVETLYMQLSVERSVPHRA